MIKFDNSTQDETWRPTASMSNNLLRGAILTALFATGTAVAQQTASDTDEPPAELSTTLEEVAVTGTLIRRADGYEAPTPVSVLGEEALRAMPVTQIGEAVERMPVFQGSQNVNNNMNVSAGTAGTNLLDLRGLGANRTLVLLDGKRVVAAALDSDRGMAVDITSFPDGLVKRVEVVTGGASAVYGSDAMAGVVNFILDKEYTGFKATAQGGITTHGDGETGLVTFTGGIPFADGRGHFMFDLEHGLNKEIKGRPRSWAKKNGAYGLIRNPAYPADHTQPLYLTIDQFARSDKALGGLINGCEVPGGGACPIRGIQFGANGVPEPFEYGSIDNGTYMSGGSWETARRDLDSNLALEQSRDSVFARASYELSESVNVYGEVLWAQAESTNSRSTYVFNGRPITIYSDNPFIPASVKAQMDANGIDSFEMGTYNADAGFLGYKGNRESKRFVLGVEGQFQAMNSDWGWDVSYVTNTMDIDSRTLNNSITDNYYNSVDVVMNNGQAVCRINADADPLNDDPACAPYNNMGTGVLSQAAYDYVYRDGWSTTKLKQEVISANLSGEPFNSWAGPVSLALGGSYRTEEVSGTASELDQQSAFFAGNYNPTFGEYDVTEAFVETVVPLINDAAFAKNLDINGAVRWTDYSTSGQVTTWKAGLNWQVTDDLRFRATRSHDIRAPGLADLFVAGASGTGNIYDPSTDTQKFTVIQTRGNPNVKPEEADSTGIGFVYQPSWFPGFSMSIDYYDIEIDQAILTISGQEVVDRCFDGNAILCNSVLRGSDGLIDMVINQPQNVLGQFARGYDLEATYMFPLSNLNASWQGDLTLRAMGTYIDKLDSVDATSTDDGVGALVGGIGDPGFGLSAAKIRYLTMLTYANGAFDTTLTVRGMDSAVYSNRYIVCVPGTCPEPTGDKATVNNNHIPSIMYFDLGFNYEIGRSSLSFSVQNLLDESPPKVASTSQLQWSALAFYERLGRVFRVGLTYEFQ